jgi:hypothetical protein
MFSSNIRSWEQDESLGILVAKEDNYLEDSDAVEKLSELIVKANKIVAFTGAGVSVGKL